MPIVCIWMMRDDYDKHLAEEELVVCVSAKKICTSFHDDEARVRCSSRFHLPHHLEPVLGVHLPIHRKRVAPLRVN